MTVAIPALVLRVVGANVDLSVRALRLTYEDRDDAVDKVTIQLANPDLWLLDQPALLGGALWQVTWGAPGAMARPRAVQVRAVRGLEVVVVEGHAHHTTMDQTARSAVYEGLTRSQILAQVAARHGYEGGLARIAATTAPLPVVHQVAETDARFLRRMAQAEGFAVSLDDERLVIGPPSALGDVVRTFVWRPGDAQGDVLALTVESDLRLAVGHVEVRGRDPREKRTVVATARRTADEARTFAQVFEHIDAESGRAVTRQRGAPAALVVPAAISTVAAAEQQAAARLRRLDGDAIRVTLRVVGDVTLRARQVVTLAGAGTRVAGRYLVRGVKHEVSSEGYTSELALRRLVGGAAAAHGAAPAVAADRSGPAGAAAARPPSAFDRVDAETGRTQQERR